MLFIYLYHHVTCTLTCGKVTCILDPLPSMCTDHVLIFCGTCNLLPDLCLHQSCCLWTLVALQVALLQEAEWHEEDACSLDSTHGEIGIWIVTCTKKICHYSSFLSSDLEMALKNHYNCMQNDRTSVIYKCTKFLHSKSNTHKTCKSWIHTCTSLL